jgi:hypothetical protein
MAQNGANGASDMHGTADRESESEFGNERMIYTDLSQ